MNTHDIWVLASDIEWANAMSRAAASRGPGRARRRAEDEYDPHAATELAMLLESRLRPAVRPAPRQRTSRP